MLKMSKHTLTSQFIGDILKKSKTITQQNLHDAKRGLIDFLSSSIAAKDQPEIKRLIDFYKSTGDSKIIGYDTEMSPFHAVRVNAYISHFLDLDDVHSDVRGHPSAVILPGLLAVNDKNISAQRFLEAYIVGVEAMAIIGRNIGSSHYEKGWHATATLGSIGSAFATSYLLGLSANKIENALGIAISQSSGLRSQFGSDVKAFQLACAAASGFEAASLSRELTIKSNPDQLVHFFNLYSDANVEQLNVPEAWAISKPGLWFKQYPCCSANYHAVDALTEIITAHNITADSVQSIELVFPPNGDAALIHTHPLTGKAGMFSVEYVSALLLQRQALDASNFEDTPIDFNTLKVMEKITRTYDETIVPSEDSLPVGRFTIAKVTMNDGKMYNARVDAPMGSPNNPLSDNDLSRKLETYLCESLDADKIIADLNSAATLDNIKTIIGEIQ